MKYTELSQVQLDALKEVSNIGAGNSATSLSVMLNCKIDMTVPCINIIEFDEFFDKNDENEVIAVMVKVLGDVPGCVLYVFNKDSAMHIINKLTCASDKEITEMGKSVIAEIGNIISASFMNAIAKFTKLEVLPSVPAVSYDLLGPILISTFVDAGQYDEYILDIETLFMGDEGNEIGGHFYYVPAPGTLEIILKSIGIN